MARVPISDAEETAAPQFPQKCWEGGTSAEQREHRGILVIEDITAGGGRQNFLTIPRTQTSVYYEV